MFNLGMVVITRGANELAENNEKFKKFIEQSFTRYISCDWGEMDEGDKRLNNKALKNGDRIFAQYVFDNDLKIWIITEWDRSVTTILLPEEY